MDTLANSEAKLRDKNIKVQIYLSFLLRGISVFLSFYVIRLTIDYLGKDLYGIWIVLLSIISWLSLCDIGIGNGLRNKLTVALAQKDMSAARMYISTSYIILGAIALTVFTLFFITSFFINWQVVFNSTLLKQQEYNLMMLIFIGGIVISFFLSLVNSILNAYQKNSLTNIGAILTSFLFVCGLVLFKPFYFGNIIKILSLYALCLITSNLLISVFFFAKNPEIIPRLSFYSRSKINDILKLGGNFFVIQIAVLLIFTVDNFIVLQLLGTEQVSVYNVVFKLFSVFTLGFGIIIAPLWSAFTEAHAKNDFAWMKKTIMRLNKTVIFVFFGLVVMLLIYQPILDFWLPKDKQITPNFKLVLSFSFFILISIWNNIYSFFLNGVGIVKMQVRTSVVGAILNIPLAILFVKVFNFGLTGIVLSMSISLFIFSIFGPIETYNFLKKHSDE